MRSGATLLLVVALATPIRSDDAKDIDALKGTWKLFAYEDGSKTVENDLVAVIRDNRIQFKENANAEANPDNLYHIVLDSSVTPKAVDLHKSDAKGQRGEKVMEGLYEIDGDTLRLCMHPQSGPPWDRPTEMKAEEGRVVLVTFRRES